MCLYIDGPCYHGTCTEKVYSGEPVGGYVKYPTTYYDPGLSSVVRSGIADKKIGGRYDFEYLPDHHYIEEMVHCSLIGQNIPILPSEKGSYWN